MSKLYLPDSNSEFKHLSYLQDRQGVEIIYTKSTQTLSISGWYDGCVSIEGGLISLKEFLTKLGITKKDCERALE